MNEHTTIAVDIAKNVFEIAVSDRPGHVSERRRLSRAKVLAFFRERPRATVVLEACGSAHHFGRELGAMGHKVRLLPPRHVRPYVTGNKTDGTDARGLLEANRNEDIQPVPVKTVAQQELGGVHRLRSTWLATRTARLNTLRGLLREFGIAIPVGARHVEPQVLQVVASGHLCQALAGLLTMVVAEIRELEQRIAEADRQLATLAGGMASVTRLQTIPGIGLLTATALVASVGEPSRFRSGRRLASFLGLVPREHSSAERRRLGGITKRGDRYLRTLLTHGGRSVLRAAAHRHAQGRPLDRLQGWALELSQRRGHNRAAIATANKLARVAWAVWSRQDVYRSALHAPRPATGEVACAR